MTTLEKVISGNTYLLIDRGDDFRLEKNGEIIHSGKNPLYGPNSREANNGYIRKYREAIKEGNEEVLNNPYLTPFDDE